MGLLYQLVLIWSVPVLLTPVCYLLLRSERLSLPGNHSVFSILFILGLVVYGLLSIVRPLVGPILLVVLLLSVSAAGVMVGQHHGPNELFEHPIPVGRYVLHLSLILLLAAVVRTYRLGEFGYLLDEPWHFKTAVGYLRTGEFQFWDFYEASTGKTYRRAWVYTWQVARFLSWFGESLTVGRLVSVLWGLLVFLPVAAYNRLLNLNRHQRLLVYLLVAVSPYLLLSSRWVRHYSMYATLYLSALVFVVHAFRTNFPKQWGFGLLALINYGLLLHLHLAPSLLLGAILTAYLVVQLLIEKNTGKVFLVLGSLTTVIVLVVLGRLVVDPAGSGLLNSTLTLFYEELSFPSGLNLLYGYYATSLSIGAGVGGLLTGIMTVVNRNKMERFFVLQLIGPLLAFLFLNRSAPSIRYAGHLIPLAIPLIVLFFSRLIRRTTLNRSWAKLVLVLVLIGVPIARFHHQLDRIWSGHQDYISFPGKNARHYKKLETVLQERVGEGESVLLLDLPSYHAMRLTTTRSELLYRSFYEDRISRRELQTIACDHDDLWVVATYAYRDPTQPEVENYLRERFQPVPLTNVHGVNLYHRSKSSRCD